MGSYLSTLSATYVGKPSSQEVQWTPGIGPVTGTQSVTDGLPPRHQLAIGSWSAVRFPDGHELAPPATKLVYNLPELLRGPDENAQGDLLCGILDGDRLENGDVNLNNAPSLRLQLLRKPSPLERVQSEVFRLDEETTARKILEMKRVKEFYGDELENRPLTIINIDKGIEQVDSDFPLRDGCSINILFTDRPGSNPIIATANYPTDA